MRFLADESFDFGAVRALREADFDVLAIVELDRGIPDRAVAEMAHREGRLLLTEDKDFGQLVYAAGAAAQGVVLTRFPAGLRQEMIVSVVEVVQRLGPKLRGRFVVVQPGRVRISGIPAS